MNKKLICALTFCVGIVVSLTSCESQGANFNLSAPGTLQVNINPSPIMVDESAIVTISLTNSADVDALVVSVSNSQANVANLRGESCVLSTDAPTCNLTLIGESIGHTTITATSVNYTAAESTLTVNNAPGALSFNLAESRIVVGTYTTATLDFMSSTSVSQFIVQIESTLPSSVTINPSSCQLSGTQARCVINIYGESVGKTTLYTSTDNYASESQTIKVNNGPGDLELNVNSATIASGQSSVATAVLSDYTGNKDFTINFAANESDPNVINLHPESCTLSKHTDYQCNVTIDTSAYTNQVFTITAQDESGGYTPAESTLTVGSKGNYAYIAQQESSILMQCRINANESQFESCFNDNFVAFGNAVGVDVSHDGNKVYISESNQVQMCNITSFNSLDLGSCQIAADATTLDLTDSGIDYLTGGLVFDSVESFVYLAAKHQILGCTVESTGVFTSCNNVSNFADESYSPSSLNLQNGTTLYVVSKTPDDPVGGPWGYSGAVLQCTLSSHSLTNCSNPSFGTSSSHIPLFDSPSAMVFNLSGESAYVTNEGGNQLIQCHMNGEMLESGSCIGIAGGDSNPDITGTDMVLANTQTQDEQYVYITNAANPGNNVLACNLADVATKDYGACSVATSGLTYYPIGIAVSTN